MVKDFEYSLEDFKEFEILASRGVPYGYAKLSILYKSGYPPLDIKENKLLAYRYAESASVVEKRYKIPISGEGGIKYLKGYGQYALGVCLLRGIGTIKNEKEGILLVKESADSDNPLGQWFFGMCYENGWGVGKDINEAIRWYKLSAWQGCANAEYNLAIKYCIGEGIERNEDEAFKLSSSAVLSGHAQGQNLLYTMYSEGIAVKKDKQMAFKLLELSAKQGCAKAMYNLALAYKYGDGVKKDKDLAQINFQNAAQHGDELKFDGLLMLAKKGIVDAQFYVGVRYEEGYELARDYKKAFKWYDMAAKQGHIKAKYKLGQCYAKGWGVQINEQIALLYFKESAVGGDVNAQAVMASYYRNGSKTIEQDWKQAIFWYKIAAEQGHIESQFALASYYYEGTVEEDRCQAEHLYRKAAAQGHGNAKKCLKAIIENRSNNNDCNPEDIYAQGYYLEYNEDESKINVSKAIECYKKASDLNHTGAQYALGVAYEGGKGGLTKDIAKAITFYTKAAEQGHASAQFNLGLCYANGKGVAKDEKEAVKWYRKAAEQGDASAQDNLGLCYLNGKGVAKDEKEALEWLEKAAIQGDARVQTALGVYYENGWLVAEDEKKAVDWYRKAAEQGDAMAQEAIKRMETKNPDLFKEMHDSQDPAELYAKGYYLEYNDDVRKIDVAEAVKYYKKAADLNHGMAQYALGVVYEFGKGGLTTDLAKAITLYTKAAGQGLEEAIDRLQEIRFIEEEKVANTGELSTGTASEEVRNYNLNSNSSKIEQAVEQIVATSEESKKQVLIEQTLVAQVEHEEKAIEGVIDSRNEKVEEELREVQEKLKEIGNRTDAMWAEYVKKQAILLEQQAINTDPCASIKMFYREIEKNLSARLSAAINLSSGMLERTSTKTEDASEMIGCVVGRISDILLPGIGSLTGKITTEGIKYAKGYAQELKYANTAETLNNVVAACELSEILARKLTIHFRDNGNLREMSINEALEEAGSLSRKSYGYIKSGEIKDNSSLESIALEIVEKIRGEINNSKQPKFSLSQSKVKLKEDPNFKMLEHKVNKINEGPSGELLQKLMDRRVGDVEKASINENIRLQAELEKQQKEMAEMKAMMALLMSQQQGVNPMNTAQASTAMPTQHRSASLEQRTLPQLPPRRSKSTDQVPASIGVANIKSRFEQNQNTR